MMLMKNRYLVWLSLLGLMSLTSSLWGQECVKPANNCNTPLSFTFGGNVTQGGSTGEEQDRLLSSVYNLPGGRSIYSLTLQGEITFTSPDGYFSAVLVDTEGKEYLIYRDVALFHSLSETIALNNVCWETDILPGVTPKEVIVKTRGCTSNIQALNVAHQNTQSPFSYLKHMKIREREVKKQIARINNYNQEHDILWRARETSLSFYSHQERKGLFAGMDEDIAYGFEHYGGGIYMPILKWDRPTINNLFTFVDESTGPYVDYFDWRKVHGINWNSPCRDQGGSKTCWAQAPTSALEAYLNRYYGHKVDSLISLSQIVSCSGTIPEKEEGSYIGPCSSNNTPKAMRYLAKDYIVSEKDFPFDYVYHPCSKKPTNPNISYKVERVVNMEEPFTANRAMHTLINKGPFTFSNAEEGHVQLMVGYGIIKPGQWLTYWEKEPITISQDHPAVGKVYWICKDSYGDDWGNNGYAYFVRGKDRNGSLIIGDFSQCMYIEGEVDIKYKTVNLNPGIVIDPIPIGSIDFPLPIPNPGEHETLNYNGAYDDDHDGYYRWGLSGKPQNRFIPDIQDGDDSDPLAGPRNEYGHCQPLRKTDLYVRDVAQDKGVEPYDVAADHWESPDVWIRLRNDNGTEHQQPEYPKHKECYVKVRLHNKGTVASNQGAKVYMYWSYGSPTQWWDSFHGNSNIQVNGKEIKSGGLIGSIAIPSIQPGASTIVTIPWTLPTELISAVGDATSSHLCLLAEINDQEDPYHVVDHNNIVQYVKGNNNVAQKNIHILKVIDTDPIWGGGGGFIGDFLVAPTTAGSSTYRLEFEALNNLKGRITDYAEVSCHIQPNGTGSEVPEFVLQNFHKITPRAFMMEEGASLGQLSHLQIQSGIAAMLRLKVNFLTQKATEQNEFILKVRAFDEATDQCVGGQTYIIRKAKRPYFRADFDLITNGAGQPIGTHAHSIGEEAQYNWIDQDGHALGQGASLDLTHTQTSVEAITLSVEAAKDGFKDYTTRLLTATGGTQSILMAYPSPTDGLLNVTLSQGHQNGSLRILSMDSGKLVGTIATRGASALSIDLSTQPTGLYSIRYYVGEELMAQTVVSKN